MSRGDWLHEQLFERRIVLVSGRLDDGVAARAAAALLALDAGGSRPIELHLSSPDGELGAALVLIDTADALRSAHRVHCRGELGGPVVVVVAATVYRNAPSSLHFPIVQVSA